MSSMTVAKRDAKDAFDRLTKSRMVKLQHDFKLIRNLANPYNYEYTPKQLDAILADIHLLVWQTKMAFEKGKKLPEITKQMASEVKASVEDAPKPKAVEKASEISEVVPAFLRKNAI